MLFPSNSLAVDRQCASAHTTMKGTQCGWTKRCFLFLWLFNCHIIQSEMVPVQGSNSSSPVGNDIAAALTAREACIDADHSTPVTGQIAACHGEWKGHVTNASTGLCAEGFSVCSWEDGYLLKQIPWPLAAQIPGCYVYDAAEEGGRCRGCREDDVQSDDLAGIGHDCPHLNPSQSGCLAQGRISALVAGRESCSYMDGITTGALCCRRRPSAPVRPQNDGRRAEDTAVGPLSQMVRLVGERVQLRCPLALEQSSRTVTNGRGNSGSRNDRRISWFKDGRVLPSVTTATWNIKFASTSDSGVYSCRSGHITSSVGHINLTINSVHSTACLDGASDGFHHSHHVRACAGAWTGHVRRATAALCGKGWRVCTPKDRPFLDQIDPIYLIEFGGCFGYNAAHIRKRCRKCKDRQVMAALGGDCPVNEKMGEDSTNPPGSCYSNRKIAAYSDKAGQPQATSGCNYRPNSAVTGVMCCRRWRKGSKRTSARSSTAQQREPGSKQQESSQSSAETGARECYPACRNGGTCLHSGQCLCPKGYTGQACQHGGCSPRCLNGGECLYGFCKCVYPFHGDHCQFSSHMPNDAPVLSESSRRTLESNKLEDSLKRRRALARPHLETGQ